MRQIYQLVKSSFRIFWHDRVAVALTFIVPLALLVVFGSIFGGSATSPQGVRLALLNQSGSPVAKQLEATIDTMKAFRISRSYRDEQGNLVPFDTSSIKRFVRNGNASAALIIPPDALSDTLAGLGLKLYYDPKSELETQIVLGLIQQAAYAQMPYIFTAGTQKQAERALGKKTGTQFNREIALLVGRYFKVDTSWILNPQAAIEMSDLDSARAGSNFFQNIVRIDKEQIVGQDISNQWVTRSVGGWAMMFLLFTLTASASSLFEERKSGLLLRMLSSPVSRTHILWSKYIFNMSLGVIQMIFMFFAGWVIFRLDIFMNPLNLLFLILASSMACTSFGMLLAGVSQTRQQAQGLGTLLILTMSALGGAWFPTSFMPPTVQFFSKLTLVYWSIDGFLEVLWRGVGFSAIFKHLAILVGIAMLVNMLTVWRFKRGHIFD